MFYYLLLGILFGLLGKLEGHFPATSTVRNPGNLVTVNENYNAATSPPLDGDDVEDDGSSTTIDLEAVNTALGEASMEQLSNLALTGRIQSMTMIGCNANTRSSISLIGTHSQLYSLTPH